MKEHDKNPLNQTKDEEIGSLPEKEFRMIVNMIQNLEKNMELQINRLETWIENFNKDLEEIKESFQSSSVAQSCLTLCDPINCSTPGLPVHHQLPEFTQTHVH